MVRKSKQAGGNKPLSHYEMTQKFRSSQYGTTTARLSGDSQLTFGDCALSLSPAQDPVATPSGHIYSREAIVEYLLTKTMELKTAQQNYERYRKQQEEKVKSEESQKKQKAIEKFEDSQKATTAGKKRDRDCVENALRSTSYWLAEFQPEHDGEIPDPPPKRPASPHSGQPLRRKELRDLKLERQDGKVVCSLSQKTISTQPVVALPTGEVILKDCYEKLVKPTMVCPFTSKKLKDKHILELQKGKSGFASSGSVEAKKYRPTIT